MVASRSRTSRTLTGAFLVALLVASACTSGGGTEAARSKDTKLPGSASTTESDVAPTTEPRGDQSGRPVGDLDWHITGTMDRGTLIVPLDHDDPSAGTIEIALARRRASNADERIGILLVNPGGPGASGVDFAAMFSFLFSSALRDRFDLIGFDPRGIGSSTQVTCADGEFMDEFLAADPIPETPAAQAETAALVEEFAAGCEAQSGWLLPHIHTEASARDMDAIRVALGEEQITYVGFSYGTYLGATYGELFPDRLRAAVLDGAYSRSLSMVLGEGQAIGFERTVDTFLDWCRTEQCPLAANGDPSDALDQVLVNVRAAPLSTNDADGRDLTIGLAWTSLLAGMYTPQLWAALGRGLAEALNDGDGSTLIVIADLYNERSRGGEFGSIHAAFAAYNCLDHPRESDAESQASIDRIIAAAPRVGPYFAAGPSVCDFWPVPPRGTAEPFSIPNGPPVLVIATTGDPATPYEWGVQLASELETAILLSVEGDSHTSFGEGIPCVDAIVEAYLIGLAVPEAERCAA